MQYIECLQTSLDNAHTLHGQALLEKMRGDVQWFSEHFEDDPQRLSGWGHQYFCADDGAFLTFDRTSPKAHRCPICGRVYGEDNYNAAWVYLYRYEALMSALEAAALYRLEGGEHYLDHFRRIVGFYSDHYDEFAVHGKGPTTSGNGKITPQALNEAIFLVKTVNGLEILKEALPADFVEGVCRNLLLPGARFVNAQKKIIHNIPCWINSAVGTVGLFAGDAELVELAFDAPLGLADQVRQGVTESFFWYEGSIHYNCFTLEAFLNQLLLARLYGKEIPADVTDTIYNMMLAPCRMAFSNSVLPNPNDGWPNLNLKTYSYLYEMAAKVFDSEELREILAAIYAQPVPRTALPMSSPVYAGDYCMEWLLFSRPGGKQSEVLPYWTDSFNFDASCYAMLRQKHCEVFFKYGHRSPSHAHPDKMNLEVTAFGTAVSRDLSNCGYAARLCNEYHRTSVSHNTVVVDGENHPGTQPGECLAYDGQDASLTARVREAYPGVDFRRSVQLSENGFADEFVVLGGGQHTIDWFFHVEGEPEALPEGTEASLGYTGNGYQHLQQVQELNCDGPTLRLNWNFGGVQGVQELETAGKRVFLCRSYDNPVNRMRWTVILRAEGPGAAFAQRWQFQKP